MSFYLEGRTLWRALATAYLAGMATSFALVLAAL